MIAWLLLAGLVFANATARAAEDRDARVRRDLAEVKALGLWVYNDFAQGRAEAQHKGKPLLVVLRCVP